MLDVAQQIGGEGRARPCLQEFAHERMKLIHRHIARVIFREIAALVQLLQHLYRIRFTGELHEQFGGHAGQKRGFEQGLARLGIHLFENLAGEIVE